MENKPVKVRSLRQEFEEADKVPAVPSFFRSAMDENTEKNNCSEDSGHFTASPSNNNEMDNEEAPNCNTILPSDLFHPNYSQLVSYDDSRDAIQQVTGNHKAKKRMRSTLSSSPESLPNCSASLKEASLQNTLQSNTKNTLKPILESFNSLYNEKLRVLDDAGAKGDSEAKYFAIQKKNMVLEAFVKDICMQNMVLVHTVEELEKEAEAKVEVLQNKIQKSTNFAKEHMEIIEKYEVQVQELIRQRDSSHSKVNELVQEIRDAEVSRKKLFKLLEVLRSNNDGLCNLILRIRDMGVWDITNLDIGRENYDQIFGLYPSLVGSEIQTVFSKEKTDRAMAAEKKAKILGEKLDQCRKEYEIMKTIDVEKDRELFKLTSENVTISKRLNARERELTEAECLLRKSRDELVSSFKELNLLKERYDELNDTPQDTTSSATNESPSQMHNLVAAVDNLKSEVQKLKKHEIVLSNELSSIKDKLSSKEFQLDETKGALQDALESLEHKNAVISKLKENNSSDSKTRFYQNRCEKAQEMLDEKASLIDELGEQLHVANLQENDGKSPRQNSQCASDYCVPIQTLPISGGHDNLVSKLPQCSKICHDKCMRQLLESKEYEIEELKTKMKNQEIEIKMQKITLIHLQDALVAAKRGEKRVPVPTSSAMSTVKSSSSNLNKSNISGHEGTFQNNNNKSSIQSKVLNV